MSTIHDVARLAGVSAGTVSNVLNRPSYVKPETRQRVLDAMAALNFSPRGESRQFRAGRQRTLGFALADMGNPFFVDVALGAESAAKALGVGMVIVHNGEDTAREEQNLDLLIQQRVQGIMITPVNERNPRLEELLQNNVPIVFVDRISGERPCCWLATDDYAGGRLAGAHLLERGHRILGFVGDRAGSRQIAERHRGFTDEVRESNVAGTRVEHFDASSWDVAEGRAVGASLADRPESERPTAVFCANDMLALGVLQELVGRGIRVPDDVSIIGFDDLEWADRSTVPLTTIRQPRALLGETAVRLVLAEINEGPAHVHEHVSFAPELVSRASTDFHR